MKDPILKKQKRLQEIHIAKYRLWRRISRTVNAYDKLIDEERRLLKPRKLDPHEVAGKAITGSDHHKIMNPEFFDDSEVLGTF